MKRILPIFLLVAALAAGAGAQTPQPQYGDIVVAIGGSRGGVTEFLPPANPVSLTPLSASLWAHWVRMGVDNNDLVVSDLTFTTKPASGFLLHVHPGGGSTRRIALGGMFCDGFALDEDGWIGCGRQNNTVPRRNYLFHAALSTLTTLSAPTSTRLSTLVLPVFFNEMAIDRDPGNHAGSRMPYVMAACCSASTVQPASAHPMLLRADRRGNLTTILTTLNSPIRNCRAIEVDPRTGDFLVLESSLGLLRISKTGNRITILWPGLNASALKITQDHHVWIGANKSGSSIPDRAIKFDLSSNSAVLTLTFPWRSGLGIQGIEVYGSRTLVCSHQTAAPTATVTVRSRAPTVTSNLTQYRLAASFARRQGHRFAQIGEWLDLDVNGPLFLLSAQGLWPGIFQGFQGTLGGGNGVATAAATIAIPQPLQGSNIPVFVAGVLYDVVGPNKVVVVRQVTNTHWIVL